MAYCDIPYVLSGLRERDQLTATSEPTISQAEEMLIGVEARIDAALAANQITVPVTAPDGLMRWLREIAAAGTRAAILKVAYGDGRGSQNEDAWGFWEKRYEDDLAKLWAGQGVSEIAQGTVYPASYIDYPDVDLGDGYTQPAVTMSTDF